MERKKMLKIEADTLEEAYKNASDTIGCSITELSIEIIQNPSPGVFGFFKKKAIIIATRGGRLQEEIVAKKTYSHRAPREEREEYPREREREEHYEREEYHHSREKEHSHHRKSPRTKDTQHSRSAHYSQDTHHNHESKKHYFEKHEREHEHEEVKHSKHRTKDTHSRKSRRTHELNSTIIPQSFVHDQEDDSYEELDHGSSYTADYDDSYDEKKSSSIQDIAYTIEDELNELFDLTCFDIEAVEVSVYNEETVMVNFKGADAALLIGKEGYRYKALSYMLFNWINSKYDLQVRLEIAEFLQNQEEAVDRYLVNVYATIEQDGRAQTKILDGVLVQIALQKLRDAYPDKYVVIRSTRDGLKYIIVNDYHSN
jgi:spoIIIJ-associated protein